MSGNSIGKNFVVTTFGESHGRALGCVIDGCPPGMSLSEADIQIDLERRRPGKSRHTTQRKEPDEVQILLGVFEGITTGTPIGLLIENQDQRSRDYGDIKDKFRPGHADYTYQQKYGVRDYRGGGRSSAREKTDLCFGEIKLGQVFDHQFSIAKAHFIASRPLAGQGVHFANRKLALRKYLQHCLANYAGGSNDGNIYFL